MGKITKNSPFLHFLLVCILSGIFGCNVSPENYRLAHPTGTPIIERVITLTVPPSSTGIMWPTRTGTPTSLPTLETSAAIEEINRLFETNGGCSFPCFWGITPGETTWGEALSILQPISIYFDYRDNTLPDNFVSVDLAGPPFFEGGFHPIQFEVIDGIVQRIMFRGIYSVSDYVSILDQPEYIWYDFSLYEIRGPDYSIEFSYPSRGISIFLQGNSPAQLVRIGRRDYIELCWSNSWIALASFSLWNPLDISIYEDMRIWFSEDIGYSFLNNQESDGLGEDTFFSNISSNTSRDCLREPVKFLFGIYVDNELTWGKVFVEFTLLEHHPRSCDQVYDTCNNDYLENSTYLYSFYQ